MLVVSPVIRANPMPQRRQSQAPRTAVPADQHLQDPVEPQRVELAPLAPVMAVTLLHLQRVPMGMPVLQLPQVQ
ncbi:MAG TPA: hypothetical protein PLC19_06010 [Marmoricola sp.]|nr:hypothetical protein [Marmoricola sp.]